MTLDLVIGCEHAELGHACEQNGVVNLDDGPTKLEADPLVVKLAGIYELPEGWTVAMERGAPRVRCPEHSNAGERLR